MVAKRNNRIGHHAVVYMIDSYLKADSWKLTIEMLANNQSRNQKKKTFIEDYCESSNALDAGGTQI